MFKRSRKSDMATRLAFLLVCWMAGSLALGKSNQAQADANKNHSAPSTTTASGVASTGEHKVPAYLASNTVINKKASREYQLVWGIDDILVKQVASGSLIRFSYRVLDPAKAKVLNDEKLSPQLVDEASHYALQIPVMDMVGKLRQTATPEPGREYWMVFSNKGGHVKPGNRVAIIIGSFRIDGLIVQ